MHTRYQLLILGSKNELIPEIKEVFIKHITELGLSQEFIVFIDETNFENDYIANAPAYCCYFGNQNSSFENIKEVEQLINDATLVLPIVDDIRNFDKCIPDSLRAINGFELSSSGKIEQLVSSILEGLSLLRLSRRLFISYKRDESSTVAIQLYEQLEKAGFDVFLDTHSIRPGEKFQDELWHRLADTDVVVLLNTPGFLRSNWTKEELAKASMMSIGILQLIWPTHTQERESQLSIPLQLQSSDFGNEKFSDSSSYLVDSTAARIVSEVESLRARSLAARQDNIVTEFASSAANLGVKISLQPEKFIIMQLHREKEVLIVPTVGVPQAFTYHQSEELVRRAKSENTKGIYLLYDHRSIREKWIEHLAWLDEYLHIKTIKITEVDKRIKELING